MSEDVAMEDPRALEDAFLEEVLDSFVPPVLLALSADGVWSSEMALTRFLVVLPVDAEEAASIQLNEEGKAWEQARARRDVAHGEVFEPSDFVTRPVPVTEGPNRFIRGTWEKSGWKLEYKFGGDAARSRRHLEAAEEFLASAIDDLEASRFRSGFAAAFHAGEHLAKAELLYYSLTAALVAGSKTHSTVRSTYAVWAHLSNTDQRFADALNWLDRERPRATYLQGEWTSEDQLPDVVATLGEMQAWVAEVLDGRGPTAIHAVSTRPIKAGSLLCQDDLSLWPPRTASLVAPST